MFTLLPKLYKPLCSLTISVLCWFGGPLAVVGQSLPSGFNNVKAQDGYAAPIGLVFGPGGQQQYVWEKGGKLWVSVWNGSQYVRQAQPVIDLENEIGSWGDFGLLGVALDPNFAQNGFAYFFYTVDRYQLFNGDRPDYDLWRNEYYNATICRLTRYRLTTDNGPIRADYDSRRVLLGEGPKTGVPVLHASHAGGTIVFGRDGSLLLSTGDNASFASLDKGSAPESYFRQALADSIIRPAENVGAFRSQMLTSLCGKILRLDPNTGDGISSNPHFDAANPRSAKSRVWALGFRNPYRMTIQPNTGSTDPADANPGTLLIGDVGWDGREDMHLIKQGGENAGWPLYEGIGIRGDYAIVGDTLQNRDEPNPHNSCNKPFLTFGHLLRDATNPALGPAPVLTSPCGSTPLPGPQRRFYHSRPALDWQHSVQVARVPTFNGSTPTATPIAPDSPVAKGTPFQGNCAVGGAYYPTNTNGNAFPADWQNTYFFADYAENWIRAATLDANGVVTQVRGFLPDKGARGIVDVEYNPLDGALYFVEVMTGEIRRISYGGSRPPVAVAAASSLTGTSPLSITFTGSNSTDPDGGALTYLWDFGDGTTATEANPTKQFQAASGRGFTVRLTVTDANGLTDSKTLQISLNNAAPTARITGPVNDSKYPLDKATNYTLTANVTDDEPVGNLRYAWQVTLRHNNHEHRDPVSNAVSPAAVISPVGCDGETYYYLITLTVTDAAGLTAQDSVKIYPDCNSPKLAISGLTATTLSTGSARLGWTNPTIGFDNVLVVAKLGSGFQDKPDQPSYTANPSYTGNGDAFHGGKVLYQGVATALTVTELTPGQTYYFRVYTRKGTGWTGGVEMNLTMPTDGKPTVVTTVEPGKCYRLTARVSGKVLGVEGGAPDDGGAVRQRTDGNQAWQQWKFEQTDPGYYRVIAAHSNKVIDVWWSSQDNGVGFHQWGYTGSYNQQYALQRNTEGYFQITARHSGKALDVQNSNQSEGGMVIQFTPNGSINQQWLIEERTCISDNTPLTPVLDQTKCYRVQSRASGLVLNVPSGLADDGIALRQNTNADRPWQKWRFSPISGGYYRVSATHTNKGIEVANASVSDGMMVQQWTYWGGNHQQWTVQLNAEGFYTITNRNSGKVLDVKGNSIAEGSAIVQQDGDNGPNQQWSITETTCPAAGGRVGFADEPGVTFSLRPNPARDHVLIDLGAAIGQPVALDLLDLAGRPLQQVRLETAPAQYRLDTSELIDGLYLIQITPDGQQPTTLRVVVQR
jgi:glucose/arabinose dehydrogenase